MAIERALLALGRAASLDLEEDRLRTLVPYAGLTLFDWLRVVKWVREGWQ